MFTFDAFAFIQVTFFAFVMFGFAGLVARPGWDGGPRPPHAAA